jgi:hypothetical protein
VRPPAEEAEQQRFNLVDLVIYWLMGLGGQNVCIPQSFQEVLGFGRVPLMGQGMAARQLQGIGIGQGECQIAFQQGMSSEEDPITFEILAIITL